LWILPFTLDKEPYDQYRVWSKRGVDLLRSV
jgi:hypothetical protein